MSFVEELRNLINRHSMENGSNTPDFLLAAFLRSCLEAFNEGIAARDGWYGLHPVPGTPHEEWLDPETPPERPTPERRPEKLSDSG